MSEGFVSDHARADGTLPDRGLGLEECDVETGRSKQTGGMNTRWTCPHYDDVSQLFPLFIRLGLIIPRNPCWLKARVYLEVKSDP